MRSLAFVGLLFLILSGRGIAAEIDTPATAQALGKARAAVEVQPDGLIVCEAEEFQPAASTSPGWQAKRWGENYYAATFANTFLSRKAFLGAPQQCERTEATIRVKVPAAGRYLALVRYEAAYRFETQFRVVIEQNGKKVFDRLYGARNNTKIWAFSQKLKKEVGWSWGAVENIVWEGHDAFVNLKPGSATITLVADKQPMPAARRNADLVMLTTDVDQVKMRIDKERYLPLDGMLTQSGDVWLRVTNLGSEPLTFKGGGAPGGGNWQQHSPYWVHIRNWTVPTIEVAPGKTSQWTEVGGTMDSLNDGQWSWTGNGKYKAEFGLRNAAGKIESLATFTGQGALNLAADADTRYSRRLRTQEQVLYDLLDELKTVPTYGKTPKLTPIYASTFTPLGNAKHTAAVAQFKKMFAISDTKPDAPGGRGYIDVRSVPTAKLAEYCTKLGGNAKNIAVVSLGDEIGLPAPRGEAASDGFRNWLKSQGVKPSDVDPRAGGDWSKIAYNPDAKLKGTQPGLYYWSKRYLYHYGIQAIKQRTDILRRHLPNAAVGANFSPHYPSEHMFLGEVFKWVTVFRDDGMTLPWSEDYIWQVPIGTPQMNNINLDLFRAGLRGKPDRKIQYYVMPHMPNNTPNSWRRLFYGALAHGAKIINLFEFRPVHVAYTENHVDDPAMYKMVLRSFRELGLFEDIIQDGHVRGAETALWFSETGDIWGDSHGSFAAAKRALYTAIRHQQVPLDFVVEQDALDGTLSKYKALYLTDAHVSRAASTKIAQWVNAGGSILATAGAGMFDELNQPNRTLRELFGVDQTAMVSPDQAQIQYIKQDLPFAQPIDHVKSDFPETEFEFPVFAVRSQVKTTSASAKVLAKFKDGSPAVIAKQTGKGVTLWLGLLPGLTYYKPAIPLRPVDRGATDDAMIHFLPTQFDTQMAVVLRAGYEESFFPRGIARPVVCSDPLVETTTIDSKHGSLIPLVNWSGKPIEGLEVTIAAKVPTKRITLASGRPVQVGQQDGGVTATFDLDAADALILR